MPELLPYVPGSPEWLAARRAGVTATDIVTILGLSPSDSVYSLFWRKMGQVPEQPDSDRLRLGRVLEPYVVERWDWENPGVHEAGGLFRSSQRPWQMATLDQLLLNSANPPAPAGVLEVKTWADADKRAWGQGELPEPHDAEWARERTEIPPRVRAQVLWQMDVMGVAVGHVGVVFLPSGEFRSYVIEHERSGCGMYGDPRPGDRWECAICADLDLMRAAGEEFMGRLRLEASPPDPDSSAATLAAVRARFTRQPDKQAEINAADWYSYVHVCGELKEDEEFKRAIEIRLREQAGEASVLTVDGQPVARMTDEGIERVSHD